jgi:hypothetical protein
MPITLKYILTIHRNKIDKPSNPLKQGISHNHKQGTNFMATRKLSDTMTSETLGNQTSKRLVIPYKVKEGSKARKEEEAKEGSIKSI